ncbi:MAG TPA: plastocyanin/azurin family copper-binding protein [archaeon]|nr:plastocyanin/azurin family copper-binding protein [archaeon]
MISKKFFFAAAVLALLFAGCTQAPAGQPGNTDGQNTGTPQAYTIEITDEGYSPGQLTIKQGDTVTWISRASRQDWPASARHPTHTAYPGSGIEKCGTNEQGSIFDACKALSQGESYSFTFNEKGEWAFHNHITAKTFGKIIVQ